MCAIAALQPTYGPGKGLAGGMYMCNVASARRPRYLSYTHHRPRTAGPRTAPLTYTLHRGCSTRAFCEKCHRQRPWAVRARAPMSPDLAGFALVFLDVTLLGLAFAGQALGKCHLEHRLTLIL